MAGSMNINEVRSAALTSTDFNMAMVFALLYLGDAVREACGDIGPALKDAGNSIGVELGSLAQATGDIGR